MAGRADRPGLPDAAVQLPARRRRRQLGPSLYVVSTTLVLMALVVNLRQPGFWLITLGALANFAVIVANGGQMPASPEALAALNGSPVVPTTDFSNSVIAGARTRRSGSWATSSCCRGRCPFANVFSIGDVLIGVGGALFIVATMHGRAVPRQAAAPARADVTPHERAHRCMPTSKLSRDTERRSTSCAQAVAADGGAALYLDDGDGVLSLRRVRRQRQRRRAPACSTGCAAAIRRPPTARRWSLSLPGSTRLRRSRPRKGGGDFTQQDRDGRAAVRAPPGRDSVRSSPSHTRASGWTRQLEAIQRIAARLTRLASVEEVGATICSETRQVIDYDEAQVLVAGRRRLAASRGRGWLDRA